MDNNYCSYCNRYYRFKDIYDQHMLTCDYFNKSKKNRDREIDCIEKLPSQQEMYKYIQFLAVKCDRLQKDVEKLKANSSVRCKNAILNTLNSSVTNITLIPYQEWINTFTITICHLECVFKENLTAGIKLCILDRIKKEKKENIPIRSFKQKTNNLYIYSYSARLSSEERATGEKAELPSEALPFHQENLENVQYSWKIMAIDDYERMISTLFHQFIVEFMNWQDDNRELIETSEKEREKNLRYMIKIHNVKTNEEKQKLEIRKWLYSNFENDLNNTQ